MTTTVSRGEVLWTLSDSRTDSEIVEDRGYVWREVPAHLAWGLEKYLIVRTESGARLILCHVEFVSAGNYGGLRERPVVAGELGMWEPTAER